MTPFERALAAAGNLVAAWDLEDNDDQRLALFSVGDGGAHKQAETDVPAATREDMVDRLVARGVRIGAMYAGTRFVWVADEQGYAVWTDTACTARSAERDRDIERVHVWLDPEDQGHRGVRFDLAGGGERTIAEEKRPSAAMLSYGEDDLYYETFWAHYLSLHLALWHEVPLQNDIAPTSIESDLAVRRAALELAKRLESDPNEHVISVGAIAPASELALRASNGELEVRVKRTGSTGWLAKTLTRGTAPQVRAFLRRVTTPPAVLRAMNALLEAR
ncbi:MAG: hypothetical protein HOV81_01725 [Kofleriaceae bacterium]|nr:hypothetical protein [Kofleriaceae bacterium]